MRFGVSGKGGKVDVVFLPLRLLVAFAEVVGHGLGGFIGRRLGVDSGLFSV